VLAVYKATFIH